MSKCIMLQGTSSHVGKSILTTALCRIFFQEGQKVVPFKAQNMALNSYVTKEGLEMGRAQVAQAEAACLEPMVDMNPVLLKPTGNSCSQVILNGKPIGNMSAREYHKGYSLKAFDAVKDALARLEHEFDTIVIEGAGSPAEINLKANDIVNMRVAKHLHAPVLLVADIDRGGALASLVGTLELLDEDERALVKGLIINKFRGDVSLLMPAVDFLEKKTGKPVLGIVPYIEKMGIDDEDSVSLEDKSGTMKDADIRIAVIRTPKISNFTDFDSLAGEEDTTLIYAHKPEELEDADLILLPGSKNTTEDMLFMENSGMAEALRKCRLSGKPIIGICGGYQMLGEEILDPHHTESEFDGVKGLAFLPMKTTFEESKLTSQVEAECSSFRFLDREIPGSGLLGYEIHMGQTEFRMPTGQPLVIRKRAGVETALQEGLVSEDGQVFGTYIHGIFDNDDFRRGILNAVRLKKGLPALENRRNVRAEKQQSYERLAAVVRESLDMELLHRILEDGGC